MEKIDTMQMVRKIRNHQLKETEHKSFQDIIRFFQEKARRFTKKVKKLEKDPH